jgi:glucose/mannose transport system substrate-binding protein
LVSFLTFVSAAACGNIDLAGECGSLASGSTRVGSWWAAECGADPDDSTGTAEVRARKLLEAEFTSCNPQAEVEPDIYCNKQEMSDDLPRRFDSSSGNMDAVLLNAGSDVLQFTPCGVNGMGTRLLPIASLGDPELLARPFLPEVLEAVSCEGQVYAVPVGLHRLNTLYFNRELLTAAGCSASDLRAEDFDAIVEDLDRVWVRGTAPSGATCVGTPNPVGTTERLRSVLAIATASGDAWAASLFVLENLMVSAVGADAYETFWRGHLAAGEEPDVRQLTSTLDRVARLAQFFTPEELTAHDAFDAVRSGRAIFTVMGDWHGPDVAGSDVELMPFPGTEQVTVFTADVFAVPVSSKNPSGAAAWLRTITSREVQERYIPAKGGGPVRTDMAESLGGIVALPGLPTFVPAGSFDLLAQRVARWLRDVREGQRSDEALLGYIESEYCSLAEARCEPWPVVR